jgi:phage terminase large subunit
MAAPEWFDFLAPDYETVYQLRAERLQRIRTDPGLVPGLKEHYKANPVDFINDWGMTFDPRNAEIGLPTVIPFMMFPKQEDFITWVLSRWQGREDGLAEKSRDMGISWLCVGFAVWMWTFYPGVVIGFGSRKEEYVDKLGDPKSLFWKVRQFVSLLPAEFRPKGYQESKHAPHMRILNPENGSAIIGEAGDNIGRGNRTSIYFKDESAFYERPEAIDAALSQTSNCKIDLSTVNGNGNPFFKKRHSGKIKVFTFHWRQDPRKSEAWYLKQKETLDPVIVAQEIDIDYNASTTDAWIPGDTVAAAQGNGPADVEVFGGWSIGVDAAHYGDDESVIHKRCGRLNLRQVTRRLLNGPQLAAVVVSECDDLIAAGGRIEKIVIELDGPGVSCYDQLRAGRYARYVVGVHTGAKLSDGKNYNVRALMWRDARDYLAQPPVSMDGDSELKSQIASVKYKYKDGLLLMQSKKEYKAAYGKSPDRADAFVLSFAGTAPLDWDEDEERDQTGRSTIGGY